MKKTLFKTMVAILLFAMTAAYTSCTEKESENDDNSTTIAEEEAINVETPRYIALGSDGNLYVTCYYPRCVARFDMTKKKITAICKLGNYQPEGIAEVSGKLYVASGYITDENSNFLYDNKLYVVDLNSFTLSDSITVGRNPEKVKRLDDNHIVFNTLGDYINEQGGLWIMNVNDKSITKVDVNLYNFNVSEGNIYGYTSIYNGDPLDFYKVEGASHQTSTLGINWTATDSPYGIARNPYNGDIIITTDGGYTANGDCHVYRSDGTMRCDAIQLGLLPSKIAAISDDQLIVLNEGSWSANNASVSKVDVDAGTAANNYFENANNRGLGDVAQDIVVDGGNAYITVSFSNSIEIMDINTGKSTRYATTK